MVFEFHIRSICATKSFLRERPVSLAEIFSRADREEEHLQKKTELYVEVDKAERGGSLCCRPVTPILSLSINYSIGSPLHFFFVLIRLVPFTPFLLQSTYTVKVRVVRN